jgi:hypothetical protein
VKSRIEAALRRMAEVDARRITVTAQGGDIRFRMLRNIPRWLSSLRHDVPHPVTIEVDHLETAFRLSAFLYR